MKNLKAITAACMAAVLVACSTTPPVPPAPPIPEPEVCPDLRAKTTDAAPPEAPAPVAFEPGKATPQGGLLPKGFEDDASPTLIGGRPANPAEFPASVYARFGNSACSNTIIGPRTVLSAGHCMQNGGTISFNVGANAYTARCSHMPLYRANSTADVALCFTDRDVTGVPFEVVATTNPLTGVGDQCLLAGYGCTQKGGGGGNDGTFRIGEANVIQLPQTMAAVGVKLRVAFEDYAKSFDTILQGLAALCFGDSGGAAYKLLANGMRVIFGVNSRGDIQTTSYITSLFAPEMVAWFKDWSTEKGTLICGVHPNAPGCRNSIAPPMPEGKFVVNGKAACVEGAAKKGFEPKREVIRDAIQRAVDSVR